MHVRFRNYFSLCGIFIVIALLSACGGKVLPSSGGVVTSNNCDPLKNMCGKGEYCDEISHTCEKTVACELPNNPCANGLTCDNGECVRPVSCPAGLCPDGQICQNGKCFTGTSCNNSSECKAGVERCKNNVCVNVTGKTDLCATSALVCGAKEKCENNACKPDCASPCGGVCCGDSEICYKDQCVNPCSNGKQICGPSSAPVCCGAGTSCIGDQCVTLGAACNDGQNCSTSPCPDSEATYCPLTRYCAEISDTDRNCILYTDNPSLCLLQTVNRFTAKEKLLYNKPTYDSHSNSILSLPVVADFMNNGKPDIAIITYPLEQYTSAGILRIISGTAGTEKTDVTEYWQSNRLPDPFFANPNGSPAVGDLDGDHIPDLVITTTDANGTRLGTRAVRGQDGSTIWSTTAYQPSSSGVETYAIANLDQKGAPEVIMGSTILDGATGKELPGCQFAFNVAPIVADLYENGRLQVIVGTTIIEYDGTSCRTSHSGYEWALDTSAVADIYPSIPGPEIVTIASSQSAVIVSDRDGQELWRLTMSDRGGPPTIADFDGDEQLEIAYADRNYYTVIKPDINNPRTPGHNLWKELTKDKSSGFTGSSVFDFDGDGKAEAVYFDEDYLRIYDGATGTEKLKLANSSVTGAEYPVIVDADDDGHADIVVVGNTYTGSAGSVVQTPGLRVITDANNKWVNTRKIWNQHSYHYTNVNDNGTIPLKEKPHWKEAWSNTFRQNVQKGNNRLAPDVVGKFTSLYNSACGKQDVRTITYTIENNGSKSVAANQITNTVYARKNGESSYSIIHQETIANPLPVGGKEVVTFEWNAAAVSLANESIDLKLEVDDGNNVIECRENNTIEKLNLPATPPNVAVSVSASSNFTCNAALKDANIQFELFNDGSDPILAGSVDVKVVLTLSGTTQEFTKRVRNKGDIAPNAYETISLQVPVTGTPNNRPFDVKIIVDPDNHINECNEGDNEYAASGSLICYQIG